MYVKIRLIYLNIYKPRDKMVLSINVLGIACLPRNR